MSTPLQPPFWFFILVLIWALAATAFAGPVEILTKEFRGAVQPQAAVAPGGRVHVVFGKDGAIYHTSSPDGRSFAAPVKIAALEKLALGMRRGPRITATNDLLLVAAISHSDGLLHTWLSADVGRSWGEGAVLNSAPQSAREGLHALAGDGRGKVAAAWLDLRNGRTELWSRVSSDSGRTWQPETLVYAAADGPICQCCHPSLAFGPNGALVAMWRNSLAGSRDLWLAVSTDGGHTFPNPAKLGTGTWKLNACPMDGGSVAFDPTGRPVATWRRETTVFASDSTQAEQRIADQATQPVLAIGEKGRWLVWEERGVLKRQHESEPTALLAKQGRAAALATLPDGRVFAVWENTAPGGAPLVGETFP